MGLSYDMRRSYADLIARGRARYGDRWSEAGLDPRFIRWYESQDRVKVHYESPKGDYEMDTTGTVAATSGWQPSFMLMRTSRSIGSSYLLGGNDTVVAVKRGRKYEAVR